MSKTSNRLKHNRTQPLGRVGDRPGLIRVADDAPKPAIHIISFNAHDEQESKGDSITVVINQLAKCQDHTHWIEVKGLGDVKLFEDIQELLQINPLVMEDITNTHQRPKFDEYEGYFLAISRIIRYDAKRAELHNTQLSMLVKDNIIFSFEETYEEHFAAVKSRIKSGKGIIRTAGPGYLCYALMDTIIDEYFVILANIGDSLDDVEDRLYQNADKSIMYDAQHLKRATIMMRRACWPERDKINDMLRSDNPLINADVKTFLKDAYDHCIQIMDLIESYKEITSSIIDLYLSMVSNRMNEIMKVLTIISVLFIPLTFIAGIYGMNFARVDPVTNKVMPANMPELYSPHGYIYVWVVMLVVATGQVIFFWRKGWFSKL